MYQINAISRETSQTTVECYASGFESYAEARAFADKYEMDARRCGWSWVVVRMAEEATKPACTCFPMAVEGLGVVHHRDCKATA